MSAGYLALAIGNPELAERSLRALSGGEGTLASDLGHRAARAALPASAQLFAWLDAGRVVRNASQNPLLLGKFSSLGLDRSDVRWAGPDRVTTALAMTYDLEQGVYTCRIDALNIPALAALWAAAASELP